MTRTTDGPDRSAQYLAALRSALQTQRRDGSAVVRYLDGAEEYDVMSIYHLRGDRLGELRDRPMVTISEIEPGGDVDPTGIPYSQYTDAELWDIYSADYEADGR